MSHNHVSRETMAQALDGAEHTIETLRAEIDRLRSALEHANEKRGEACAELADARAAWDGTRRTMTLRIEELQGERDAANQRAEEAEQLAEDRLRMIDVAVKNAADAAGVERVENLDLLRDLHGTYRRGSAAAAAIRDAIGFIEQRGTHRTGGK